MQKWEYYIYTWESEIEPQSVEKMLNDRGKNGWELIKISRETNSRLGVFYFKRAKVEK